MSSKKRIKVPLTQNEYNALLSFSYNSGPGVSNPKKKLYSLINTKQYVAAGFELEKTLTNNGQLLSRRKKESDIWFTNNPGDPI
jgi:GH24 family phage-related lysozyme (muramidase)